MEGEALKLSEAIIYADRKKQQSELMADYEKLLSIIEAEPTISRMKIAELTGWSRVKINGRIQTLREKGLLDIERKWIIRQDHLIFD